MIRIDWSPFVVCLLELFACRLKALCRSILVWFSWWLSRYGTYAFFILECVHWQPFRCCYFVLALQDEDNALLTRERVDIYRQVKQSKNKSGMIHRIQAEGPRKSSQSLPTAWPSTSDNGQRNMEWKWQLRSKPLQVRNCTRQHEQKWSAQPGLEGNWAECGKRCGRAWSIEWPVPHECGLQLFSWSS